MSIPVAGAHLVRTNARYRSPSLTSLDREYLAFEQMRKHIRKNLTCVLALKTTQVPVFPEKLDGFILLETWERVSYGGIFVLVSGIEISEDQRGKLRGGHENLTHLKFVVDRGSRSIAENSRKLYHLQLGFPERPSRFPPPMIASEGKLMYKMHVFMSSQEQERKPVLIAQTMLEYRGSYSLPSEDNPPKVQQQMICKRPYLGLLGKKKTVNWKFSTESRNYLPGGEIRFSLWLRSQFEIEVYCRLELIQKVWYEPPSTRDRSWKDFKLKINPVTSITNKVHLLSENENRYVWKDKLNIPGDQVCTYEIDFNNSVNYVLCITVQDKTVSSSQECKILIGSNWEIQTANELGKGTNDPVVSGRCSSRAVSLVSLCSAGSDTTMAGMQYPPSYSQLSSRRSTLETRKVQLLCYDF